MSNEMSYLLRKFTELVEAVQAGHIDPAHVSHVFDELLHGAPTTLPAHQPPQRRNWQILFEALGVDATAMSPLDAHLLLEKFLTVSDDAADVSCASYGQINMIRRYYGVDGRCESYAEIGNDRPLYESPRQVKRQIDAGLQKIRTTYGLTPK